MLEREAGGHDLLRPTQAPPGVSSAQKGYVHITAQHQGPAAWLVDKGSLMGQGFAASNPELPFSVER